MKLVLMDRGLWDYVTGDEAAPVTSEEDKKEKEVKEYRQKCEKAYSLIGLNRSPPPDRTSCFFVCNPCNGKARISTE